MEGGANSMIKTCVVLDGEVINIGEWDYMYEQVEIKPAVIDKETGEMLEPAEYEVVVRNPLPDGAIIEEREFEYSEEYGWREMGYIEPPTEEQQRLLDLEMAMAAILGGGM